MSEPAFVQTQCIRDYTTLTKLDPLLIPWDLIALHDDQARKNHCGQSLVTLNMRGGLSPSEAIAILDDKPLDLRTFDMEREKNAWEDLKQRIDDFYES